MRFVRVAVERPLRAGRGAPAARAVAEEPPEPVAHAVIDLITGPLSEEPYRIGRELRHELHGVLAGRRGTYRVLYRIDDARREVTVIRIDHRRDVYRS